MAEATLDRKRNPRRRSMAPLLDVRRGSVGGSSTVRRIYYWSSRHNKPSHQLCCERDGGEGVIIHGTNKKFQIP